MNKNYTLDEARNKMGHYCAYQDRCHKEVRDKLMEMHMIPEAIDHIMGYLIEHDYLNEQRFAENFARGKFRMKKWGKVRIKNELKKRELTHYTIHKALEQISDQEYEEVLDQLVKNRLKALEELGYAEKRKKLSTYLLYRGWENQLVQEKLQLMLG